MISCNYKTESLLKLEIIHYRIAALVGGTGVFITNVFSASVSRAASEFHACEVGVNGLERRVRTCASATMGRAHGN